MIAVECCMIRCRHCACDYVYISCEQAVPYLRPRICAGTDQFSRAIMAVLVAVQDVGSVRVPRASCSELDRPDAW